ncbi:MAG: hypothetical protein AB7F32_10810 [Victivallaceae bacterium]
MELIFRLMPVVGMILILFIVPTLVLTTLVFAVIADKMRGLLLNIGGFITYLLWFGAGIALIFTAPFGDLPWWFPFLMFWLLFGSIPHTILLVRGMREENRWKFRAALLGMITTILASCGIELLCYSARFY